MKFKTFNKKKHLDWKLFDFRDQKIFDLLLQIGKKNFFYGYRLNYSDAADGPKMEIFNRRKHFQNGKRNENENFKSILTFFNKYEVFYKE